MKILSLCAGGSCRSVAMLYELRDRYKHDVLHAGLKPVGQDTLTMLCEWADIILTTHSPDLELDTCLRSANILEYYKEKTYSLELGKDRWRNPMDQSLRKLIRQKISSHDSKIVRELIPQKPQRRK